jgi:hypothetical protein
MGWVLCIVSAPVINRGEWGSFKCSDVLGKALSLRQFVCYLLGYLSFVGLVLFIAILLSNFISPSVVFILSDHRELYNIVHCLFALMFFILMSVFTTTIFWALYFLTDSVNRTD